MVHDAEQYKTAKRTGGRSRRRCQLGDKINSYNELEKTVGYTGRIKTATDSANTIVKDLEARQEALSLRLETIEKRYRAKFTALDTLISSLNTTSSI